MASNYKPMPLTPRDQWKVRRPGYQDPALPPVHAQGGAPRCASEALTGAMEYILGMHHKYKKLDVAELHSRFAIPPGPSGPAIGDVIAELIENGVSGVRIKPPVYDCRGFAGGMSAVQKRWPVIIDTLDPVPPGAGGWVEEFKIGKIGHVVFGYKAAFTKKRGFGIWCMQSRGSTWNVETGNCFILSEALLKKSAIYAIRELTY